MDPDRRISEHLTTLYLRGKIKLDDEILDLFWERAPDELRAHAMRYIGEILPEVDKEALRRSKLLWESRFKYAENSPSKGRYKKEIATFGWWFVSRRFDNTWSLQQLLRAIRFSKRIERSGLVVKRLSELITNYPKDAILCFKELVDGEVEHWDVLKWRSYAEKLLSQVLESTDPEARKLAEEAINKLGSKGYLEFGKLLGVGEK